MKRVLPSQRISEYRLAKKGGELILQGKIFVFENGLVWPEWEDLKTADESQEKESDDE